jgi:hypothetical protein
MVSCATRWKDIVYLDIYVGYMLDLYGLWGTEWGIGTVLMSKGGIPILCSNSEILPC